MTHRPLILITNDDGIASPGLHAAAEAVADLGELLIAAPSTQRTGAGRSYPPVNDKAIYRVELPLSTGSVAAYKADLSPAQAVMTAVVELVERPIDLCISGINYGENLGSGVTISGTIGAAIEAATFGIPALAISLETPKEFHLNHSTEIDFDVAAHFTRLFTQRLLTRGLPPGVDFLKIDIPASATPQTPWHFATVSRQRYFMPVHSGRKYLHDQLQIDYQANIDPHTLEPDSDIHIFSIERHIAVSPMTIDLTAPVSLVDITDFYAGEGS